MGSDDGPVAEQIRDQWWTLTNNYHLSCDLSLIKNTNTFTNTTIRRITVNFLGLKLKIMIAPNIFDLCVNDITSWCRKTQYFLVVDLSSVQYQDIRILTSLCNRIATLRQQTNWLSNRAATRLLVSTIIMYFNN